MICHWFETEILTVFLLIAVKEKRKKFGISLIKNDKFSFLFTRCFFECHYSKNQLRIWKQKNKFEKLQRNFTKKMVRFILMKEFIK